MTANEKLLDSFIRHQIGLLRFNARITEEIMSILNATEAQIRGELSERLDGILAGGNYNRTAARRLEVLENSIRRIREKAYTKIQDLLEAEYGSLLTEEASFAINAAQDVAPLVLNMTTPTTFQLQALLEKPFEGRALGDWTKYLSQRDIDRIMSRVKIGMVQGHSSTQIVQGILGTKRIKGVDGLTQASRRELTDIIRTATNFYGNQARRLTFIANEDVYSEEVYVATLDSRTTVTCMSLDGNKYSIGDGPYPPVHVNCRSLRVAIISDDLVGVRPFNKAAKKQLLREYSEKAGIGVPASRDALPHGHKQSYDVFAQRRGRELIGQTPARTTYAEFLERQSKEFQDEVLGVRRAQLFRSGRLSLDRFVDQVGKKFTLAELAVREAL